MNEEQYEQFKNDFISNLRDLIGSICEYIDQQEIVKVNEIKTGLTVKFVDDPVAPTIYPQDVYEHAKEIGQSAEEAAREWADKLKTIRDNKPEFGNIRDLMGNTENLICCVVNAKDNEELLNQVPHLIKDDLAVIVRYRVSDEASFVVRNEHLDSFKLTAEEIIDKGMKNTDAKGYTVQGINEVLCEMMGINGIDDMYMEQVLAETPTSPFYVISNDIKLDGAVAIVSKKAMDEAYETISDDFYIIPSSRHEILALPKGMVENPKDLQNMVEEVNATSVSPADKLSDSIYYYNSKTRSVSLVDTKSVDKAVETVKTVAKAHGMSM